MNQVYVGDRAVLHAEGVVDEVTDFGYSFVDDATGDRWTKDYDDPNITITPAGSTS